MATMYLYKIYKLIKQRSARDPYCSVKEEMTQLAKQIFEGDKTSKDILAIATELKYLETQLYGIRTYFSDQIKVAVERDDYSLEYPDVVSHMKNDQNKFGSIYVLTAPIKKNQVKIGATTIDPFKRLSIFIDRYGYDANYYFISKSIREPFSLEHLIKEEIKDLRVSGQEFGDSIEWYYFEPEKLKNLILDFITMHRS